MSEQVRQYAGWIALLLLLFWPVQALLAHDGGILQIASEPAGPYTVSVWTSPARLENGRPAHIRVGVADETDAPVLDATVLVQMISLETDERVSVPATTEQSTNKLFYEADLILPAIGRYTMHIQINGPKGSGAVTFPVEVQSVSRANWFLLGFTILGIILAIFLFRLWVKQPAVPASRQK